jgi:hypothetical protein
VTLLGIASKLAELKIYASMLAVVFLLVYTLMLPLIYTLILF